MNKIYIAATPYNLLISIIKTILAGRIGKDDIFIYKGHISSTTLKNVECIFNKVYCFDKFDNFINLLILKIYQSHIPFLYSFVERKYNAIETLLKEREIFIFSDNNYYGCLLNFLKKDYHLIEDGLNCLSHDPYKRVYKDISKLYSFLGFSWKCFGQSEYTKSIEVNDLSKVCIKHPNIIEVKRDVMFKQLNKNDIDTIAKIFNYEPLNSSSKEDSSLLITQPLSEDGYVSHAKKISIYKHLIEQYAIGTVYIKVHPRDKDDYSKLFPNAIILGNKNIPIEVLLLKEGFHFKRAISTFTTAMDAIFCADEKIQLGLEWTLNFKDDS